MRHDMMHHVTFLLDMTRHNMTSSTSSHPLLPQISRNNPYGPTFRPSILLSPPLPSLPNSRNNSDPSYSSSSTHSLPPPNSRNNSDPSSSAASSSHHAEEKESLRCEIQSLEEKIERKHGLVQTLTAEAERISAAHRAEVTTLSGGFEAEKREFSAAGEKLRAENERLVASAAAREEVSCK